MYRYWLHGLGFGYIDDSQSFPVRNFGMKVLTVLLTSTLVTISFLFLLHHDATFITPLDIYLRSDRVGILPVRQWIDRLGRYRQPKCLASSLGTFRFDALSMTRAVRWSWTNKKALFSLLVMLMFFSLLYSVPWCFSTLHLGRNWRHHYSQHCSNPGQFSSWLFTAFANLLPMFLHYLYNDIIETDGRRRGTRLAWAQSRHS